MPQGQAVKVTLSGFREYHRALRSISQPELTPLLKKALREAEDKIIVPAIKSGAPTGPSPHRSAQRGDRGKKGPLKKSIRTKQIKKRSLRKYGALVGYTTAPRAWYGGWVTGGTKPHGLLKGAKRATNVLQAESFAHRGPINRWHPGILTPNDFIRRGEERSEARVLTYIHRIILLRYTQRVKA